MSYKQLTIFFKSLVREDNAIYFSWLHLIFDMCFLIKGETSLAVFGGLIFGVLKAFWFRFYPQFPYLPP